MSRVPLLLVLFLVLFVHILMAAPTEPFYHGDETRHVMTGIFVADAVTDGGLTHPKSYALRYYAQYPALGLIVWPPGFYAVEGAAMLAFGRDFETGRWLTVAYCLLACIFAYRLVCFTHNPRTAFVATLVFAFSREVFFHSRNVMLEVPMIAFILMMMFFLERFLREGRRRDLLWAGFGCVLAGLHRYDAVLLILYVLLRIIFSRRWALLLRRDVLLTALMVIFVLSPVYLLAFREIGSVQTSTASKGTDPTTTHNSRFEQYTLFFATLWAQVGHVAFAFGCIGLLSSLRTANHMANAPYWSIALATYLFFAPMAEQESRHAIPWIISWCVWSVAGAGTIIDFVFGESRGPLMKPAFVLLIFGALVGGTMFWTLKQPVPWLHGYGAAAEVALKEIDGPGVVLFDGHFSGTIVYELRTRDADRRLWLARADKLFYAALSDPSHGYVEYAANDEELKKKLAELNPDLVIVEEPRARTDPQMAKRFRELMKTHQDYVRVGVLPVSNNNLEWADGVTLIVYKPKVPRPPGERTIRIPMLWQGTEIDAVVPKK